MVVYYGKKIEASSIGGRVVHVACDKCGCEYFYELARIGTGSGTAPYGMGASAIALSVREESQSDLQLRLRFEAELVPCPKCNWINEELVQGFRMGRYRRLGLTGAFVGVVGTVISLLCAWIITNGPPADRGALPYFLFAGPALFISFAVALLLFRSWMRSRIQPNRNFPLAPKLPAGTPPALIANPTDGEIQAVAPQDDLLNIPSEWIEFQIGRHELPLVCCDCLKNTTIEDNRKYFITPTVQLGIPHCTDCVRKSRREFRRIRLRAAAVALLVGGGLLLAVLLAMRIEAYGFWVLLGFYSLIAIGRADCFASKKTAAVKFGRGDLSRGIIMLRFRNPEYRSVVNTQLQRVTDAI